jgi:hypothetical protein
MKFTSRKPKRKIPQAELERLIEQARLERVTQRGGM